MFGMRRSRIRTSGSGFLNDLHDFTAVGGLADDFDVFFQRQQLAEAVTNDRMIVC